MSLQYVQGRFTDYYRNNNIDLSPPYKPSNWAYKSLPDEMYTGLARNEVPTDISTYSNQDIVSIYHSLSDRIGIELSTTPYQNTKELADGAKSCMDHINSEFNLDTTAIRVGVSTIHIITEQTDTNTYNWLSEYINPDIDVDDLSNPSGKVTKEATEYVLQQYQDLYNSTEKDALETIAQAPGVAETRSEKIFDKIKSSHDSDSEITVNFVTDSSFGRSILTEYLLKNFLREKWITDTTVVSMTALSKRDYTPCVGTLSPEGAFIISEVNLNSFNAIPTTPEYFANQTVSLSLNCSENDIPFDIELDNVRENIALQLMSLGMAEKTSEF